MKKFIIRFLLALIILLIVLTALLWTGDTNRDEMMSKYGGDQALFVDDGHNGQIHYRDEGNKEGPALLLVHGSNSHLHTWEDMVGLLKGKYRLISYDQPGHGLTGPSGDGDYRGDDMAAAGVKVLDAVGVEKAIWVGNSMGGWVSWRAALSNPERVSGLVLIDASGAQGGEKITPYLGARILRTGFGQAILPHITPRFMVKKSLDDSVYNADDLSEEVITRYWEMLRFPGNRQATLERGSADREIQKWDEIGSISVPTLILWGEEDSVIPVSHAELFAEAISDSEVIIYPKIGHLPMEEDALQVAQDIDSFVSSQDGNTFLSK